MRGNKWVRVVFLVFLLCLLSCGEVWAQAPTITGISPSSGPVGTLVQITGTNFGATQGSSSVSLSGASAAVVTWSATAIGVLVPSGVSSGSFSVTVSGQHASSSSFTITSIPQGWSDGDIGSVGLAGSSSYANGVFTVKGAGTGVYAGGTSDSFHFVNQSLSGNGTIVARVVSLTGGSSDESAGVMIRETLSPGATNGYMSFWGLYSEDIFTYRPGTGLSTTGGGTLSSLTTPYWVMLVRNGSTFNGFAAQDGVNWVQVGTLTLDMAQNAYVGLGVTSNTTTALATATFDSVSVTSAASPTPIITSVSATTGLVGNQVMVYGSGFGAAGVVTLNGSVATIDSWSSSSITITIPSGAASGNLIVSVAPAMNDSNPMFFTVTSQPLPSGWLDEDVGQVGMAGNASYTSGVFTVQGAGQGISSGVTSDSLHFVYQPLSGDGTVVARVVSLTGGSSNESAGVMIRETLNAGATNGYTSLFPLDPYAFFTYRPSTGASTSAAAITNVRPPYWVKLVRNDGTFAAYAAPDGVNWVQVGTTQSIEMAQNVFVGLGVTSNSTTALATATFDNVSVNPDASPSPVISNISATTGSVGGQVVISGSGFGASQGSSLVTLNAIPVTIASWSSSSITLTIPSAATSGYMVVSVAPSMNDSNPVFFTVTTQPLTSGWLDQDVGQVGLRGSATYGNGVFTVQGAGQGISGTADAFHFVYQPVSGNGTIVARIVTVGSGAQAGVMIRNSLNPADMMADADYYVGSINFHYRTTPGGTASNLDSSASLPYWVMLVRAGSTFSVYMAPDGVNWVQIGTSQTITMSQNVFIGLGVSSDTTSSLATATFDNVSISSATNAGPVITTVSATTASVGNQILISGSGFGASQTNSVVKLNNTAVTINSWSASSISITIPSGATSGNLVVSVAPAMNDSNPVFFTVTSHPLPTGWLDQDIGLVGMTGNASYASSVFTIQGAGQGISSLMTSDSFHFVYQSLPGDGTIVARVVSLTGGSSNEAAGVMIRETLNAGATSGYAGFFGLDADGIFYYRPSTGASTTSAGGQGGVSVPYWVKVVRSGSTFNAYSSSNGSTWTQLGATETLTMAQGVYIGLGVTSNSTSELATATLDNVSITSGLMPFVASLSPVAGAVGTSVTINGTSFGSTKGTSTVTFNGTAASSVTSWSNTKIVAVVPTTITTGPVVVTVNSVASNSNVVFTAYNPVINSVTPPAAPVAGQVTLSGYGFGATQGSSTVQINGLAAYAMTWSNTNILVSVPQHATSGPVTLTMNGVTSNGVSLTVLETPTITGVSPSSGPLSSSVTVSGTGFGPSQSNSTLTFNSTTATVTSWSDTSITTTVPTGASTGPVTVEVANDTVFGPTFEVTESLELTDSLGHQTSYSAGMVGGKWYVASAQGSGCSSCTVRGTIQNQFDSYGNVTSVTDPLGYVTFHTYDSNANVLETVQPAVGGTTPTTTYTYNSFGEVLAMTDPLGHITTNSYDSHGNLLTVTLPGPSGTAPPSITQFAYNSLGELTQITDPLGRITAITYTSVGYIAAITDPQSNVTTYAYDSRGNRTSLTDALNHQTTFAYDSGNRLLTITYPDTTTASFTYDYRGRRIAATDQNGKKTTYAYDDADRLTSVTDPASNVTQYNYDTESNLLSIEDANSHTTSFTYDAFGRVTETTFPSTHYEQYAYDADNDLTSKTDRNGNTITYLYDALNRLTQKSYPNSTSVEYTYDLVGKVLQVNDPTGTYGFSYDNMGRLIGTTTQYTFLPSNNFTNSYTYDANSNRLTLTDPQGGVTSYAYDTLNRLSTLTPPTAFSSTGFGFSYDALSRRIQMTRPNGVTTNYTYDSLSHLLSVLHQVSSSTIDGAAYTYDSAGNRTAKTNEKTAVTSNYTYDPLYELTKVTQSTNTTESYSYDPVGNRLSSLGVSSYTNNSSNELTSSSAASYAYDANGNTTSKTVSGSTTNYTWDYENRLTSVVLPSTSGSLAFKYDGLGHRVQKAFTQGSTTTTNYLYDGANSIEDVDQNGNVLARYEQTIIIDEPLAELRSGTTSYYHADGLGSVTSLSTSAGALANTYTYDSFGNLTASTGSLTNRFQYTSREFDPETGVYYYRARYYDPNVGRFVSEDPIGFGGGSDFYVYVRNSPVYLSDPFGLDALGRDIGALQNIFPGSDWQPANNALVIHLPCSQVRQTLAAQGYESANGWGYNGPGSAFWNPFDHSGGSEYRTFGPGFHFRMQYDRPDPFAKCPNESCTLDQFHIDAHNPIEPGQTWPHLKCDFLHWCGS
jgi:RHS repeat-associated protein